MVSVCFDVRLGPANDVLVLMRDVLVVFVVDITVGVVDIVRIHHCHLVQRSMVVCVILCLRLVLLSILELHSDMAIGFCRHEVSASVLLVSILVYRRVHWKVSINQVTYLLLMDVVINSLVLQGFIMVLLTLFEVALNCLKSVRSLGVWHRKLSFLSVNVELVFHDLNFLLATIDDVFNLSHFVQGILLFFNEWHLGHSTGSLSLKMNVSFKLFSY